MENLTEFDIYMNAMKQINLNESAIPLYKGKVLVENADAFRKIQKLLNCDKMENSHMWLYDLDVENLDESEKNKINNLYKLGCAKGYIEEDEEDKEAKKPTTECDCIEEPQLGAPVADPAPVMPVKPTCAYTAMYSAVNSSGEIKTGEAYSNAISPTAAKMDIMNKLERAGYHNIAILCIEVGDVCCGSKNAECPVNTLPVEQPSSVEQPVTDIPVTDPITDIPTDGDIEDDKVELPILLSVEDEDSEDDVNEADEDSAKEDSTEEDKSKEDSNDEEETDSEEDKKEEKAEEPDEKLKDEKSSEEDKEEDKEDKENKETEKKEEEKDKSDSEEKKTEEPTDAEKGALRDSYKKAFKAAMLKCKFEDKSFDDLTLEEKVEFFTVLSGSWKKADPSTFMDNKEIEALEKIVVKK